MSVAQAPPPERGPSPLASNNPFRNRIGSGHASPDLAPQATRPISTNPFLDLAEIPAEPSTMSASNHAASSRKGEAVENTTELMSNMTLTSKSHSPTRGPRPPTSGAARRENVPPRPYGRMPPPNHRTTHSEEERRRQQNKPRGPTGELDIFADPPAYSSTRASRAPRRNSESSVREKASNLLDPEDDKRRRERRHRERKERSSAKPKQPSRRLDIIDKLDVTSIYGTGLFHHDGPFDACNPARNRKGSKQAPLHAFPKDSNNMRLGGSGPVNSKIDLATFNGTGQEAHKDYNEATVIEEDGDVLRRPAHDRNTSFNPVQREVIHTNETAGLGTSTFLEGAPASRAAIQRRESENEAAQQSLNAGGGLSRKKSLAQKIRAVRPNIAGNGRMTSPEPVMTPTSPNGLKTEPVANPFFKDYDQEYDRKGAQIAFAEEQQKMGRARAPSSPRRGGLGLERKLTSESTGEGEGKSGGGFLTRMKSLRGGRRARPERRDTSG